MLLLMMFILILRGKGLFMPIKWKSELNNSRTNASIFSNCRTFHTISVLKLTFYKKSEYL